jgi:hypothetical protein
MGILWKIMGVAACGSALALAACGDQKPAKPEPQAQPAVPATSGGHARIDINKGHPPASQQVCKDANRKLDAVVIEMTDVNKLDYDHVFLWLEKTGNGGDSPDGTPIKRLQPLAGGSSAAAVDASPYLKGANDVVLLQLKIKDQPNVSFPTTGAVLTEDGGDQNGEMFCVKTGVVVSGDGKTATFYVRDLKMGSSALIGHYTFLPQGARGQIIRIAIDPEVQNEG